MRKALHNQKTLRGVARELGIESTHNYSWLKEKIAQVDKRIFSKKRWTDSALRHHLPSSYSVVELCSALGLKGYNMDVKRRIEVLGLSIDHFYILYGRHENLFRHHPEHTPRDILRYIHKKCLKIGPKRNYFKDTCQECSRTPSAPVLFHLDMDPYNCVPLNLVVICKECNNM